MEEFGIRNIYDFSNKLLPQGAWARCARCQDLQSRALFCVARWIFLKLFRGRVNLSVGFRNELAKIGVFVNIFGQNYAIQL
jgi:hypothetical protein